MKFTDIRFVVLLGEPANGLTVRAIWQDLQFEKVFPCVGYSPGIHEDLCRVTHREFARSLLPAGNKNAPLAQLDLEQ
jgi:hypothetical protein